MKVGLILLSLLFSVNAGAKQCHTKQLRIAVIDSGLDLSDVRFKNHLCLTGHKNFVPNETLVDIKGHGTHIAGLIQSAADTTNFCMLIYKYYSTFSTGRENTDHEVMSIREAIRNKADIINISGGGPEFDEKEYEVIRDNPKIIFNVAAGNDDMDLDISGNNYYPASYWLKNENVIENMGLNHKLYPGSNYSKRAIMEKGEMAPSTLPNDMWGYGTGTSQATAFYTGKMVDKLSKTCYGSK